MRGADFYVMMTFYSWFSGFFMCDFRVHVVSGNLPKSLVQTAIRISVLLQGLQASGETTRGGKESVGDLT